MKHEETYYEILKIEKNATPQQISIAYQSAKNAFSKESIATYSLFSTEDSQAILKRLDEAYQTLSNPDRKREYDKLLGGIEVKGEPIHMPVAEIPITKNTSTDSGLSNSATGEMPIPQSRSIEPGELKSVREKKGLSLDEVSKITKIPIKYIKAIEESDLKNLPARVYIQGFIKNLCFVYKLETTSTVKSYLEHYDQLSRP